MLKILLDQTQETLPAYWGERLRQVADARGYSLSTIKNYALAVESFVGYIGGSPRSRSSKYLEDYLRFVKVNLGYKKTTYNLHVCALKFFFQSVLEKTMPKRFFERERLTHGKNEFLKFSETVRLFDSTKNLRNRLLLKCAYFLSLRVSELVRLKVDQMDMDESRVAVKNKTDKCDRKTCVPPAFLEDCALFLKVFQPEGYMFAGASGRKHMSERQAEKILKAAGSRAEIGRRLTFEILRSSYLKHLAISGLEARSIKNRLGLSGGQLVNKVAKSVGTKNGKPVYSAERLDILLNAGKYFKIGC